MQYVLTLTGDPGRTDVTSDHISRAKELLREHGAPSGEPDWLHAAIAVDIPFDAMAPADAARLVRDGLPGESVDVNAQPSEGRRKKLLIADMDSTLITSESLDDLADFMGIKKQVAAITARAMRGELDFEEAIKERVAMIKGLSLEAMDQVVRDLTLNPGAEALAATMKASGAYCAVVSGGFKPMTGHVRMLLGFNEDRANDLEVEDGALAGRVKLPILGREAKVATLFDLAHKLDIKADAVVTVGDGANDIGMLEAAGMGVAFRAKPAVREAASFRIDHGDLSSLLYLQGYRGEEIVTNTA